MNDEKKVPKIFVWCNSCQPEWHSALAMSEDGQVLAGHVCTNHGFIAHDMGILPDGWKRETYAAKYPDGFEVVWVEDPKNHPELLAACALNHAQEPTP